MEQSLSLFTPTYIIKNRDEEDVYMVEGPTSLCGCFKACCHCCASRDIVFRILDLKTDKQVDITFMKMSLLVCSIPFVSTGWEHQQEVEWSSEGGADKGGQIQHRFPN